MAKIPLLVVIQMYTVVIQISKLFIGINSQLKSLFNS